MKLSYDAGSRCDRSAFSLEHTDLTSLLEDNTEWRAEASH